MLSASVPMPEIVKQPTVTWFQFLLEPERFEHHLNALKQGKKVMPSGPELIRLLLEQTTNKLQQTGGVGGGITQRCRALYALAARVAAELDMSLAAIESSVAPSCQRVLVEQLPSLSLQPSTDEQQQPVHLYRWLLRARIRGLPAKFMVPPSVLLASADESATAPRESDAPGGVIERFFSDADEDSLGKGEDDEGRLLFRGEGGSEAAALSAAIEPSGSSSASEAVRDRIFQEQANEEVAVALCKLKSLLQAWNSAEGLARAASLVCQLVFEIAEYEFVLEHFDEALEYFTIAQQLFSNNLPQHSSLRFQQDHQPQQQQPQQQRLGSLNQCTIEADRLVGYTVACQLVLGARLPSSPTAAALAPAHHTPPNFVGRSLERISTLFQIEQARTSSDFGAIEQLLLEQSILGCESAVTPAHRDCLIRAVQQSFAASASPSSQLSKPQQTTVVQRLIACNAIAEAMCPSNEQGWLRQLRFTEAFTLEQLFDLLSRTYELLAAAAAAMNADDPDDDGNDTKASAHSSATSSTNLLGVLKRRLDQWVARLCAALDSPACWQLYNALPTTRALSVDTLAAYQGAPDFHARRTAAKRRASSDAETEHDRKRQRTAAESESAAAAATANTTTTSSLSAASLLQRVRQIERWPSVPRLDADLQALANDAVSLAGSGYSLQGEELNMLAGFFVGYGESAAATRFFSEFVDTTAASVSVGGFTVNLVHFIELSSADTNDNKNSGSGFAGDDDSTSPKESILLSAIQSVIHSETRTQIEWAPLLQAIGRPLHTLPYLVCGLAALLNYLSESALVPAEAPLPLPLYGPLAEQLVFTEEIVSAYFSQEDFPVLKELFRETLTCLLALEQPQQQRVFHLLALGDAYYELADYQRALHNYLLAGALPTQLYTALAPHDGSSAVFDYHTMTVKRIVSCLVALRANVEAVVMCQFASPPEFQTAARLIQSEPASLESSYFAYIWEMPMLELLISVYARCREESKVRLLLELVGWPGMNQNNKDSIRKTVTSNAKANFLKLLCRRFLLSSSSGP